MDQTAIERCAEIAKSFGVSKLVLFGSATESIESAHDLDIACEGIGGWDLFRFGAKLEEELGTHVDVVPLRPGDPFSEYVASHGRVLYGPR